MNITEAVVKRTEISEREGGREKNNKKRDCGLDLSGLGRQVSCLGGLQVGGPNGLGVPSFKNEKNKK